MARNGSGAYSVVNSFTSQAVILAAAHNANWADVGAEVTNSLALDGQSIMTGPFKAANGTVGAPSQTFGGDLDTGRYHKAADTIADACAGADVQVISTAGVTTTGTHSVTGLSSGLGHTPVGGVIDFAGTSAPTGWLLCYGQSLLRTDYAALFTAIGTTHGAADGTHFSLPDCRGRAVVGKDDMGGVSADRLTNQTGGLDGDTLGAAGGGETQTLTLAQSPAHDHGGATGSNGAHTHSYTFQATNSVFAGGGSTGAWQNTTSATTSSDGAHTHSVTAAGGGAAHNNVQPTIVLNKIIFAGV